jgi:hypothetical protein
VVDNSNIHNNGAGVGIGTTTPNASAKVEIASTTQGFLPPRMTTAQRDAIATPALGLVIYNTSTNCLNFYVGTGWNQSCGQPLTAYVSSLNCETATHVGTLFSGNAANGVSSVVPYTGGNGGNHNGQIVSSTGVTGLTATLNAATLANGSGNFTYTISGTPTTMGTALFALNIGGQACTLSRVVLSANPACSPTTVVDVTNPITGKTWMDRNLGASQAATSSTDAASYGDLFQWGRGCDGHQLRTTTTWTQLVSFSDQPGHSDFIRSDDWRHPQNNNLWQGVDGINNPCPAGYRIPTVAELNNERLSWTTNGPSGAFASPLKWPMAGYRPSNNNPNPITGAGTYGAYWSSSPYFQQALSLYFLYDFGGGYADRVNSSRGDGRSVRCIKD